MGMMEIAAAALTVVASRREQRKAREEADRRRREAEREELERRRQAAERQPDEEAATMELLVSGRDRPEGKGTLLVEPTESKTTLGRARDSKTGLGFNV